MLDLYHQPYAWVVEGCLVPTFAQCHMAALHANRLTIDAKDVKFLQALQSGLRGAEALVLQIPSRLQSPQIPSR